MKVLEKNKNYEYLFGRLSSLGNFYSLKTSVDENVFRRELMSVKNDWIPYNKSKPWSNRFGLSLFSIDGKSNGEIDLNSVFEWNKMNGTQYGEMSFKAPTKYWSHFSSISSSLKFFTKFLGRSHLIKLDEGGIFPPHRDAYWEGCEVFRLIAFFNCSPSSLHVNLDGRLLHFDTAKLYFMNTRLVHSLVSFKPNALILVLNVELNEETYKLVLNQLHQR